MSNKAIEVQNLSKRYRIGHHRERYSTLRETVSNAFAAPIRRLKSLGQASHRAEDEIWALKDISFEVEAGDVLGVIGRNGAGKSTLLKILSRITSPTEGRVALNGRVSSLLEVGTGFHPELTGRENIFLNGAILGMTRKEIRRKFDDIVAFSEIEKFIDTPVKRYSSGMYVRLAFAVAAHLEPEILLVDEVLAVGDFAFRKKCLGKMSDVAKSGRTVLFVSHNMAAVESLCRRALLLDEGRAVAIGETDTVVEQYFNRGVRADCDVDLRNHPGRHRAMKPILDHVRLKNAEQKLVPYVPVGDDIIFEIEGETEEVLNNITVLIRIHKMTGAPVAVCHSGYQHRATVSVSGRFVVSCRLKNCRLMHGTYVFNLFLKTPEGEVDRIDGLSFEVTPRDVYNTGRILPPHTGSYLPEVEWQMGEGCIS